jgi:hypothetical protein
MPIAPDLDALNDDKEDDDNITSPFVQQVVGYGTTPLVNVAHISHLKSAAPVVQQVNAEPSTQGVRHGTVDFAAIHEAQRELNELQEDEADN